MRGVPNLCFRMWTVILVIGLSFAGKWNYAFCSERLTENRRLGLFQGDIMIRNRTQILAKERNAMTNKEGRWPAGVVVYALDETYSDDDRAVIQDAIAEFERQTCITWVERTDEEVYVEIENDMGCWSELGRIGGVQSLSLEAPSCMKKGVVMHEMMHTLGFLHEQSRPDRDSYVRVMWDNIIEGMEPNFEKLSPLEIEDLGLDYDYRSIMHYTAYMFTKDRTQPTLRSRDPEVPLKDLGYGQKSAVFTDLDLKKINKFYECSGY